MDYKLPLAEVPAWAADAGFGFAFDRDFGAIAIRIPDDRRPQPGPPVRPTNTVAFALRGTVARDNVELLAKSLVGRPGFLGLFSDPHLVSDTDPGTCPVAPVGNSNYVVTQTGRAPSESPNDVLLAIVDLGFDKDIVIANAPQTQFEPALSYTAPNASGTPGSAPGDEHGNMCAYDATLVANNATLVDIRAGDPKDLRLSDATEAYDVLYAKITSDPTLKTKYRGLVLSNSWGIWAKDDNLPLGSVDRYFDNPNHPFTVMVRNLVALGADVVFAAGDSGECRSTSNNGTIWGANSLDEVISVAAVDVDKARIPYSSQGPGVLAATKPDAEWICRVHRLG